jgi:hypothetical protein
VSVQPIEGELNHAVQSSGLLEQMRCPGHNGNLRRPAQSCGRCPVQSQHLEVPTADYEQRGRADLFEGRPGEIRPTPSRDHQPNMIGKLRGGYQSSRCARAGAEQHHRQLTGIGLISQPPNCTDQP